MRLKLSVDCPKGLECQPGVESGPDGFFIICDSCDTCQLEEPGIYTKAIKIGNPASGQFQRNTVRDCFARSVWDMQYYDDRIYVGSGDIGRNIEPGVRAVAAMLWSLDSNEDVTNHFHVLSEAIYDFHVHNGKLIVVPSDNIGSDVGHIIMRDGNEWIERWRCIPEQNKGMDTAFFNGKIYVIKDKRAVTGLSKPIYSFLESPNLGESWNHIVKNLADYARFFGGMVPLDDHILIFGSENYVPCVFKYSHRGLETLFLPDPADRPDFPFSRSANYRYDKAYQRLRYKDGVLYSPVVKHEYWRDCPLFFLNDFVNGAELVDFFNDKMVRDFIVKDDTVYVLTAEAVGDYKDTECEWFCHIYSSDDLTDWTEVAAVVLPGLPYSFEQMGMAWYVGLGNRTKWNFYGGPFADVESGSIYKLER